MNTVERVKDICKKRKIPLSRLEKDLGFANAYISQLKKGTFPDERLAAISDYLGLSIEYLMTGKEDSSEQKITSKPSHEALDLEVEHDVDVIINKLKNGEEVVLRFNGDTAGDDDMELLKNSLLNMCMTAKRMSKQKE